MSSPTITVRSAGTPIRSSAARKNGAAGLPQTAAVTPAASSNPVRYAPPSSSHPCDVFHPEVPMHPHQRRPLLEAPEDPVDRGVGEVLAGAAEHDHVGVLGPLDDTDAGQILARIAIGKHEHRYIRMLGGEVGGRGGHGGEDPHRASRRTRLLGGCRRALGASSSSCS